MNWLKNIFTPKITMHIDRDEQGEFIYFTRSFLLLFEKYLTVDFDFYHFSPFEWSNNKRIKFYNFSNAYFINELLKVPDLLNFNANNIGNWDDAPKNSKVFKREVLDVLNYEFACVRSPEYFKPILVWKKK